jgi:hypothetical protein
VNKSHNADNRDPSGSKRSFIYTKIVPAALAALLIALFTTLVIVGLSVIGVIPGG